MALHTLAATRRAALAGAAVALSFPAHAAPAPAGKVDTARGTVAAALGQARRALAAGAALFIGDTVTTAADSAAALLLGGSTLVRLGPDASLRIDRFIANVGGVLELSRGPMTFQHDPAAGAAEAAVRTPFGLLAVRGTRFFAGPSNGVFGVFVAEGAVMLAGPSTFVTVLPGYGSDVAQPGGEPTEPHLWAQPRIDRAFASVQ